MLLTAVECFFLKMVIVLATVVTVSYKYIRYIPSLSLLMNFRKVAFLYYEPKQNPLSKEGGFLFVLFIFHYSLFIIHLVSRGF